MRFIASVTRLVTTKIYKKQTENQVFHKPLKIKIHFSFCLPQRCTTSFQTSLIIFPDFPCIFPHDAWDNRHLSPMINTEQPIT